MNRQIQVELDFVAVVYWPGKLKLFRKALKQGCRAQPLLV